MPETDFNTRAGYIPRVGVLRPALLICDGNTTSCERPATSSRELLENWQSSDDFLILGYELFQEWESVPLPETAGGHSRSMSQAAEGSIWNTRTVQRSYGRINVLTSIFRLFVGIESAFGVPSCNLTRPGFQLGVRLEGQQSPCRFRGRALTGTA